MSGSFADEPIGEIADLRTGVCDELFAFFVWCAVWRREETGGVGCDIAVRYGVDKCCLRCPYDWTNVGQIATMCPSCTPKSRA